MRNFWLGLYMSSNRGGHWDYFGAGLPDSSIADIIVESETKDLVIATHGRGIYKVNLSPFYESISNKLSTNYLYDIDKAQAPEKRDTHRDVEEQSVKKIPFTFWLTNAEPIKLKIKTTNDSLIRTISIDGKKGFNEYRWDLVTHEESSDRPYFIRYKNYIEEGTYHVYLESSEGILRKPLTVVSSD